MPLRSLSFPLAARCVARQFHTSAPCRDSSQKSNHYETLKIPINASASEVKKSFYTLSKTHHPDRNPDDPNASSRFVLISEAYATLSSSEKRAKYDQELHIHSPHTRSYHGPQACYHSSGPAGGRPASGLSRRRTQFRGPPPSFYRSGGWGEHSPKRKAAQKNGAPGAETPLDYNEGQVGGMGPGQKPYGHNRTNDVPHFNREGHFRTHENHRIRWQRRKGMEDRYIPTDHGTPPSALVNFFFVGGIISLAIVIPGLLFEKFRAQGKRE